jgi:hypothetical protein
MAWVTESFTNVAKKFTAGFIAWILWSGLALAAQPCHPDVDLTKPQYGVGYGSLMEEASRLRTAPNTGEALPAIVTGFERWFNAGGSAIGFSTTYLGLIEREQASITAAVYRIFRHEDIKATDARERSYCRRSVDVSNIRLLDGSAAPNHGQYWIYVNKPDYRGLASERLPLVQSYIDIFLTGCQQLSKRATSFEGNFMVQCVLTTQGWSNHWVNDRIYPRRPFIYQPNAGAIDRLLDEHVPEFKSVRIE